MKKQVCYHDRTQKRGVKILSAALLFFSLTLKQEILLTFDLKPFSQYPSKRVKNSFLRPHSSDDKLKGGKLKEIYKK